MAFCAALEGSSRCQLPALENSYHCEKHVIHAQKLYAKYKAICDEAYNLDLDKNFTKITDRITYLEKCYKLFNKAYNARMTHRRYAFVPEMHDAGHNYQFTFIQGLIDKCEKLIQQAYSELEASKNMYSSLTEETVDIVYQPEVEIIVKERKVRAEILDDTDEIINRFIKENKKYYEKYYEKRVDEYNQKFPYINMITNILREIFQSLNIEHNNYIASYFIFIIKTLGTYGYFTDSMTKVHIIQEIDGKEQLIIMNKPLYLETDVNGNLEKIVAHHPEFILAYMDYDLKTMIYVMLTKKDMYMPFFKDLIYQYNRFKADILKHELLFIWDIHGVGRLKAIVVFKESVPIKEHLSYQRTTEGEFNILEKYDTKIKEKTDKDDDYTIHAFTTKSKK